MKHRKNTRRSAWPPGCDTREHTQTHIVSMSAQRLCCRRRRHRTAFTSNPLPPSDRENRRRSTTLTTTTSRACCSVRHKRAHGGKKLMNLKYLHDDTPALSGARAGCVMAGDVRREATFGHVLCAWQSIISLRWVCLCTYFGRRCRRPGRIWKSPDSQHTNANADGTYCWWRAPRPNRIKLVRIISRIQFFVCARAHWVHVHPFFTWRKAATAACSAYSRVGSV